MTSRENDLYMTAQIFPRYIKGRSISENNQVTFVHNYFLQLEMIKSEYNSLYDYIIEGNVIRSRANWYEHGEKNNKYF